MVITPGTDLMLDFTPQSGLPSSKVPRCLARRLAYFSGYACSTSVMSCLLRALASSSSAAVLRLIWVTSLIVGLIERPALVAWDRPPNLGRRGRLGCQFGGRFAD